MQDLKTIRRYLNLIVKKINSFFNDDTTYYAASLSFFTIFSILPIIALLISILTNFEFVQIYMDVFIKYTFNILNPAHSQDFINSFKNYLSNSSKLGYLGTIYMIFVFIMFFKDYEYIVNKIHHAKRKTLIKSFIVYLIFLITLPLLYTIGNIALNFYNNNILNTIASFLFAWLIFFALFKLSINKYIYTKVALISSFITLLTLSLTKNLFVYYVIYNKTYSTIYGSLAILLFSFFWIYISWIIYLYGIKMCHKLNTKELKNLKPNKN